MQQTYTYPEFAYTQSPEQQAGELKRHPVVIIGAGPIGLTQALGPGLDFGRLAHLCLGVSCA